MIARIAALASFSLFALASGVHAQLLDGDILVNYLGGPAVVHHRPDGTVVASASGSTGSAWEGATLLSGDRWLTSRRSPNGVNIYDATGAQIGGFDTPEITFVPADTGVLSDGTLVVGDQSGELELYTETGTHLLTITIGGITRTFGVYVDDTDDIWIADTGSVGVNDGAIWEFDKNGTLLTSIITPFELGDLVLGPDGTIWCTDRNNGIVKHLDTAGTVLGSFSTAITVGLDGIGMAPDGTLWCTGETVTTVYHYDQAGTLLGSFPAAGGTPLFLTVVGDTGPSASCVSYCGTGVNAPTDGYAVTNLPVLGGTFTATITGCAIGNAGALLAAFATPTSTMLPWGELLVNVADPNGELLGLPSAFGNPAVINIPVPNDPMFAGFVFYSQAASFGGSICLHCAHECTIGY